MIISDINRRAESALIEVLKTVPSIRIGAITTEDQEKSLKIDLVARLNVGDEQHVLVCEAKQNGQPRFVRQAIYQLRNYQLEHPGEPTIPVVVAPHLSPEARTLCTENQVSYLDFDGNARLAFGTVFIDRIKADKPFSESRELKSLFKPKSARVLRVLLRSPRKRWKVVQLAEAASVSIGHVSNVRTALLDREWASIDSIGLFVSKSDELLDAWKEAYVPPIANRLTFYTTLHGNSLENRTKEFFDSRPIRSRAALSSFSAAQWISPYGRTGSLYLWAERDATEELKTVLQLSSSLKGENVVVTVPVEDGVFLDAYSPAPGVFCTSPLQTYLDLSKSGERGEEAAAHLRLTKLTWQK